MTSLPSYSALAIIILFFSTGLFSQDYYASAEPKVQTEQIASVYRLNKKLPALHSGYVIEVATSELPISRNHEIFKRFGKIFYHKMRDGGYSYVIKANFSELKSAQRFCENIIKPRFKNARVIEYKRGERKIR